MAQDVGIGIVGTGDWGANLVRNFAALPGVRLARLCDSDATRLERTAARYPQARPATRVEEVAADPDVHGVVVSASAVQHHPLAKTCLLAGKDVFVEKPLALNVADAEELVALARDRQRILMVGHLLLHHPAVRYMKDLVQKGELGDLYYVTSQRVNLGKVRHDENALWSFAPHDLSVILHLLEAEPVDVAARGSAFLQGGVEDVVFLHLRFPGGKMAHVHVSWLDPHKLRQFTVVGSRKMVVFDDMEASEKIRVYDKGVDRGGQFVSYSDALTVRSGDIVLPRISLQEPLRVECQHFIDCIRERKTPLTDGESGLQVVRVLAAAQASLEAGGAPMALRPQTAGSR
ncbi:MAG TPA: Gfo/Idh/MocA family oxidoreductase [Candidatus Eisenbacteria bacterium]|nr:Gfo/Idh/MocA family oxidoreductase [Candidatus Eisenbacteria bacterium]